MRRFRQEYELMFWIAAGWILAAAAANRLFASGLVDYRALYGFVAKGWEDTIRKQHGSEFRIIFVRLLETWLVVFACGERRRRIGVRLLLLTAGMSAGVSLVLLTWSRGIVGIFCFLVTGFPHMIFYIAAWGVLVLQSMMSFRGRKSRLLCAVAALFSAGLCSEILLNPLLLKLL